MSKLKKPAPLFDTLANLNELSMPAIMSEQPQYTRDFNAAIKFIKQYVGSDGTFRAYRREIERLLQW